MKCQALKAKQDSSLWSSAKHPTGFSKINDSVKSSLKKWIISHTLVIHFTIANDYVTVKFDYGNGVANTELL